MACGASFLRMLMAIASMLASLYRSKTGKSKNVANGSDREFVACCTIVSSRPRTVDPRAINVRPKPAQKLPLTGWPRWCLSWCARESIRAAALPYSSARPVRFGRQAGRNKRPLFLAGAAAQDRILCSIHRDFPPICGAHICPMS